VGKKVHEIKNKLKLRKKEDQRYGKIIKKLIHKLRKRKRKQKKLINKKHKNS
jgi:hypothetical protein